MQSTPLLHLVDPEGPGAARWLAQLARSHAAGAPLVALGARPVEGCVARIPVPVGSIRLAAAALERWCEARDVGTVMAWGVRACQVLSLSRDPAHRVLLTDLVPQVRSIPFDADVLCVGEALADRAMQAGWPPMRLRVITLPVPVHADHAAPAREAWRQREGLSASAFVVGLLPGAPQAGDALSALHAVGRVRMAGVDAHLLLDPGTGLAAEMHAFARSIGLRAAVHFHDDVQHPQRMAAAVDAWISLPGAGLDGTALDAAVAAGLRAPLVAASGSRAAELFAHGSEGLVGVPPNGIAAGLLSLVDGPDLARELVRASHERHAAPAVGQAFEALLLDVAARASMRAASDAAAPA